MIVNSLVGQVRAAIADTFMWAKQRKVFGEALIDDMMKSKDGPVGQRLAGPIAMLKYQTTRTVWHLVDDTVQILGGRGITRTGMGAKIEGLKNFAKYAAVYGGSEEIMADLAIKQALRGFPKSAKL